ncbi:UNVERIFIED_CONTAM: hypothetical protein FKN15_009304 [Acipenser sinensis]
MPTKGPLQSVQVFGRKKTATAVAHCKRGNGLIKVNGRPLEMIEPRTLQYKSINGTEVSITAQNKDCYESGIICMKYLVIFVGLTKIYFTDNSGDPSSSSVIGKGYEFQLWKAGYYTVVHFPKQEITILWDKKTTVHIQAGPEWKGLLTGMCGNFDKNTVNDMTTASNMEVSNAQALGDSWALGQSSSSVIGKGYEFQLWKAGYYTVVHFPKQEITILWDKKTTVHIQAGPEWKGLLTGMCGNFDKNTVNDMTTASNMEVSNAQALGDSWALGQVDVTWFYKNCLTDTCNCNRGGDCECLCTSIAAYAHKCCQQGVAVNWRSPTVCSYDCEFYNRELGDGPYIVYNSAYNDTVFGANLTSGEVFPLPKISAEGKVLFNFMIIAGLYKDRYSRLPVISFESAERPNYFLCASEDGSLRLEQWSASEEFRRQATYFHHQGLGMAGYSSFELYSQKGFFITLTRTAARALGYDYSEEFKHISSFTIEESQQTTTVQTADSGRTSPSLPDTTAFTTATEVSTPALTSTTVVPVPPFPLTSEVTHTSLPTSVPSTVTETTPPGLFTGPITTALSTTETPIEVETSTQEVTTATLPSTNTTLTDHATYSTVIPSILQPTSTCTPPYSYRVDECSEYICFNGHLMFHNASLQCRNNVSQPNCGILGMPVQINKDYCCPQWECPCRCSIISDLRVITFDGNNVALYDNGSYILVHLPRENIVAHIEKCPTSEVSVNFINAHLPFTRQSLHIDDTGTMYVINTPGGVSIQWYHSTGIIVLQYSPPYNTTSGTQGLCGCCDGNPEDDLKLPNGTVIKNVEDIPVFLYSWMVHTSEENDYFRRVGDNCTTGNCTKCFQMLNQNPFTVCHDKFVDDIFFIAGLYESPPFYSTECDSLACPTATPPECREDQFLVEVREDKSCCYSYLCVCESCIDPISLCSGGEILTVDLNTTHRCCPQYQCVCDVNLCPVAHADCTPGTVLVKKSIAGQCCPEWECECSCQNNSVPFCQVGETHVEDPDFSSACGCTRYFCKKTDVCLFQGVTVLSPGQSMIQYFERDLCYMVHCLQEMDPGSGFHAMDVATVNCSEKCGAHQVYVPSSDPHICCGSCKNVSCTFTNENGTIDLYRAGSTWVSNCTRFDCVESAVGAVVLGSGVVCPPFNDTECVQNGGTVQSYIDGCCKLCKVTVTSCDGKCPSATIFNFNINSHGRFCKCCRESGLETRTVQLYCSRNSTSVDYVFQEPTDCTCQWN